MSPPVTKRTNSMKYSVSPHRLTQCKPKLKIFGLLSPAKFFQNDHEFLEISNQNNIN